LSAFSWGHDSLELDFVLVDGRVGLHGIRIFGKPLTEAERLDHPASLVEVRTISQGSNGGHQNLHSAIGDRLVYVNHTASLVDGVSLLEIQLTDPVTNLEACLRLESAIGSSSVSATTRVTNHASLPVTLLSVSALMLEIVLKSKMDLDEFTVYWARNDWTKECRWQQDPIVEVLVPDRGEYEYSIDSRRPFGLSGLGTWSSGRYLPMGMIENKANGMALAWQVENPGPWRWEIGDRRRSLVLGTFGPLDLEHHWNKTLLSGESFTGPRVTLAFGAHGWESSIAELTRSRQRLRLPHNSFGTKPVVYNDFFALFAEPTEDNLTPLIHAAADIGIEVFCIDAGWFDGETGGLGAGAEGGHGWWDALGEYEESKWRFPGGFSEVVKSIRDAGMTPGIWLEPEVVGVRSDIAKELPDEAFFMRAGERVVEHGRYQLDLSHPDARSYADGVVDSVITKYNFGYLKVDYNINAGPGTEIGGNSAGLGLWNHSQAVLDWFAGIQKRHPDLIIMNCGSGGMRMDGAMQQVTHVQQMSDQAKPIPFAQIAVAAPTAIPSDQSASWMSINEQMSLELIEFAGVAPQLSRFEMSGPIDRLSEEQQQIAREAVSHYKKNRSDIGKGEIAWPLGLPNYYDDWLALAQINPGVTRLSVWRRGGGPSQLNISLPWLSGSGVTPKISYPKSSRAELIWDDRPATLSVTLPSAPMAAVIEIRQ
jgi:alpha-galactosidase